MDKRTQIVVKSRDCTEFGFPKKLGIYLIGEARLIGYGHHFNVPVDVLRESGLSLPRPPIQLNAESAETAHELAVRNYEQFAAQLSLDVVITELSETESGAVLEIPRVCPETGSERPSRQQPS